jgi:Universal stress protein UspA and related nucleotide-binding proteins
VGDTTHETGTDPAVVGGNTLPGEHGLGTIDEQLDVIDALVGETGTRVRARVCLELEPRTSQRLVIDGLSLSLRRRRPDMYDQILVPTDGSDGTRGAAEHAIDLATTYNAALHTVYVVDTNVGIDASVPGTLSALEEAGENAIDEVTQQAASAGVDTIEGVVAQGAPHQAVLDYVDQHDIDLVVMGTHGRTGLDRYLLGSVTEKVVRLSDVPVLTVRMPTQSAGEPS